MEIKSLNIWFTCEWVEEESYFFKLSSWSKKLLDFYEKNPDFILPKSRKMKLSNL